MRGNSEPESPTDAAGSHETSAALCHVLEATATATIARTIAQRGSEGCTASRAGGGPAGGGPAGGGPAGGAQQAAQQEGSSRGSSPCWGFSSPAAAHSTPPRDVSHSRCISAACTQDGVSVSAENVRSRPPAARTPFRIPGAWPLVCVLRPRCAWSTRRQVPWHASARLQRGAAKGAPPLRST